MQPFLCVNSAPTILITARNLKQTTRTITTNNSNNNNLIIKNVPFNCARVNVPLPI